MRLFSFLLIGMVLFAGCKKNPPDPPGKAILVEPAKNEECSPVESSSANSSVVRFVWQPSDHTEIYELRVTDLSTDIVQMKSTSKTTETLSLQKGRPFSWTVISKNSQTTTNVPSETWSFYNPGAQTSHVPFPAEIGNPLPGATVFKDIENEITLQWSGSDLDDDIESYEIYFSDETPPEVLIAAPTADVTSQTVSVVSNTVYYWKIVTKDTEGNSSDTGILDFKVF